MPILTSNQSNRHEAERSPERPGFDILHLRWDKICRSLEGFSSDPDVIRATEQAAQDQIEAKRLNESTKWNQNIEREAEIAQLNAQFKMDSAASKHETEVAVLNNIPTMPDVTEVDNLQLMAEQARSRAVNAHSNFVNPQG